MVAVRIMRREGACVKAHLGGGSLDRAVNLLKLDEEALMPDLIRQSTQHLHPAPPTIHNIQTSKAMCCAHIMSTMSPPPWTRT